MIREKGYPSIGRIFCAEQLYDMEKTMGTSSKDGWSEKSRISADKHFLKGRDKKAHILTVHFG